MRIRITVDVLVAECKKKHMDAILVWLIDNLLLFVLLSGLLLTIGGLSFIFALQGLWRRRRNAAKSRFGLVLCGAWLILSLCVMVFSSKVFSEIGEMYLKQRRLVGSHVPDVRLTSLENDNEISFNDYDGKILVVNQWATWCGPCIDEMLALEKLQKNFRDSNVEVLFVSREPVLDLRSFLNKRGGAKKGHTRADKLPWNLSTFPSSVIVGKEGTVLKLMAGAQSYEQFEAVLLPLI